MRDALAPLEFDELAALPASDVLVLTVNNRLARTITAELAGRASGGSVELPRICPVSSWFAESTLDRSFERSFEGLLIDASQAQTLWADIIGQSGSDEVLVDVQQAASLAQQADALMLEWDVSVTPAAHTPDSLQFFRWRESYEQRLHKLNAIDPSRLAQRMAQWLADDPDQVPGTVVFVGFVEFSPALQRIQQALSRAGARLHTLVRTEASGQPHARVQACGSMAEQWLLAVRWARARLTERPTGRYAIVAPSLQAQAGLARRLLARDLGHPFNIAVAPPLSQWSEGRALLAWLGVVVDLMVKGSSKPAEVGAALLAGHCVGSIREAGARAAIDATWRKRQSINVTARQWQTEVDRLPRLKAAWADLAALWFDQGRGKRSWYDWTVRWRASLAVLGFPGDAGQTSVQYQVTQALDQLLSRLAMFDDLLPPVTAIECLAMLTRLAGRTPFQPQRDRSARLDVLGLLEAEGGRWDGVWVMDMTDQVLPAQPNPNPLLPAAALAQAGAPRSTAARELQWAQRTFHALRRLAPDLVFSWPLREGESQNRASPFLVDLPVATHLSLGTMTDEAPLLQQVWQDEPHIGLRPGEVVGGGVDLLETQAINPQWAFFRYRLHTRGLRPHAQAPSQSIPRGILLHEIVKDVWDELGDHARLVACLGTRAWAEWLAHRVKRHTEATMRDLPEALRDLESRRTLRVLHAWLALEAGREPFRVLQKEQPYEVVMGPLSLSVKLDRLDELADGSLLLIDYKTGRDLPKQSQWSTRELRDIQLLVYAKVLHDNGLQPKAMAWCRLHEAGVAMQGLAESFVGIEGIAELATQPWADKAWTQQLATWRDEINALGQAFVRGTTQNRFWRREDAKYCDIPALLRLHQDGEDE